MIYHLLLNFYLAYASHVLLLDPSGEFFDHEERSEKSVSQITDLVSRSFYIGALDENTDVSSLKLPLRTPTENVQITLFGIDPASLSCIKNAETGTVVPLTIGEGAGFAASNLMNHLYKAYAGAKVSSFSASKRIAELYNVQHRANVFTLKHPDFEAMESDFGLTGMADLDSSVPEISSFMKEMDLFQWAASKFGSGSQEEPAFFYLTLNTFSALPKDLREGAALQVLDSVMKEIFQALPEQGIAQVIFSDTRNILTNRYIDEILPRRRLASNSSNSTSSNVTYEELYEYQIFYWFLVGAAFVIYFFVYCFAFMNYSNDQMLYTSFDASYKKDI